MVKNSALASISPEERDRVLDQIRSANGGTAVATAALPAQNVPSREAVQEKANAVLRPIRNMAPRAQPPRVVGRVVPEDIAEAELATEAEAVADQASEPSVPAADGPTLPVTVAEITSASESPDGGAPVVSQAEESLASPIAPIVNSPPGDAPASTKAPAGPAPMTREGSFSPQGANRSIRSMTMTARGTNDSSRGGAPAVDESKRPKARPNVPNIAALGQFRAAPGKTGQPEEQKAQKPVIKLSVEEVQRASTAKGAQTLMDRIKSTRNKTDEEILDDRNKAAKGKAGPGDRLGAVGLDESRALRRVSRQTTPRGRGGPEEEEGGRSRFAPKVRRSRGGQVAFKTSATVASPITVRSLSEAMGRPAKDILSVLFKRGEMLTMNAGLEDEVAVELAFELGVDLVVQRDIELEDIAIEEANAEDPPETMVSRPPIITILGHVDHGKTTLVDKLRSANVAASEHGGITQHIAAYQVKRNERTLTFVDTPGHAAFGEMRARGANVTDVVVLVVAANDGVMPQTVECIAHARAANVPLVVAMNKVDLPDRNEQRVLQELAAQNVLASEWGGDVEVVRTSGLTGAGLEELLDTLLITADLNEYKANPTRAAVGTCLEAFRDEGRGPLAWLIVQKGTLAVGDVVLCGDAYGKIRALYNEHDQELTEAPPSTPVKVAGLDIVPAPGDQFQVLPDVEVARDIAEIRRQKGRAAILATKGGKRTLEDILNSAREGAIQDLGLIVKADTPGSLEALRSEIGKFEHPEVRVKILHEGVGGVNESDVYLASASNAVIVAFHVIPEDRAALLAQQEKVDIRRYNIIYEVIDEMKMTLEGMLRPERKEVTTGRALVLQTFSISRFGTIAGCRVLNGTIDRTNRINLIRDQKVLNSYNLGSLRREKDDVKEVREGMECGIRLEGFNDIKEGDMFEAFKIEEVKRKLE